MSLMHGVGFLTLPAAVNYLLWLFCSFRESGFGHRLKNCKVPSNLYTVPFACSKSTIKSRFLMIKTKTTLWVPLFPSFKGKRGTARNSHCPIRMSQQDVIAGSNSKHPGRDLSSTESRHGSAPVPSFQPCAVGWLEYVLLSFHSASDFVYLGRLMDMESSDTIFHTWAWQFLLPLHEQPSNAVCLKAYTSNEQRGLQNISPWRMEWGILQIVQVFSCVSKVSCSGSEESSSNLGHFFTVLWHFNSEKQLEKKMSKFSSVQDWVLNLG